MSEFYYITLTLACHTHNGFGKASGAGFTTRKERQTSYNDAEEDVDSEFTENGCQYQFILDNNGDKGCFDVSDTKSISRETAVMITGDALPVLMKNALTYLKRVQPGSFANKDDPEDFSPSLLKVTDNG